MMHLLGFADMTAGIVLLWAAMKITTAASFRTIQGRWAFFRRLVYASTSIAAFSLGVGRLNGEYDAAPTEVLFHLMLLFGLIAFPMLRAFGWITQDQFKSVDGTYEPSGNQRRRNLTS